jgi:hypothetical protein
MKLTSVPFKTAVAEALSAPPPPRHPEFFCLPAKGPDQYFGLSRSYYYSLEKSGLLQLRRVRIPGNARGRVLVPFQATRDLINGGCS